MNKYFDDLVNDLYSNISRNVKDSKNKRIEVYKKIPIFDLPEYFDERIRGATDLSKIWLRKGMDYAERCWVLAHEIAHILNPFERNEDIIDQYHAPAFLPVAKDIIQRNKKEVTINYAFA